MSNLNNNKQNNIKRKALKRMNNHPINNKPDTLVMKVKDDEKNVYWFQDLGILTDIDRLTEVLPNRSMSYPEKNKFFSKIILVSRIIISYCKY